MGKWKKALAILLLLVMCIPLTAAASAGEITEEDFDIHVSFGLGGNCRSGAAIPVTINMTSPESDFEGTVRIVVCGDSDMGTQPSAYEKEIMLTKGSEKTITMSVNNLTNMSVYYLQVEDKDGKLLVDKKMSSNIRTGENALVGILSNDYTALNYFDRLSLDITNYSGYTKLVELNPDIMPEQASGLDVLSFLIINSFDTSELSEGQYEAIEGWVKHGGVLIIGTGADYKQTLSAFQSGMVSGTISGMKEGTLALAENGSSGSDLTVLTDPAEEGTEQIPVPGMGISYTAEQGILNMEVADASPLGNVLTDEKLLWNLDYGQGHVITAAFNLGMEPISSWQGKEAMANALLSQSAAGYSASRISNLNYGSYDEYWSIFNALGSLFEGREPDFNLLGLLIAAFILLVGPGLYLVLKLIDRREWMWVLIPVLAVSTTAGIFLSTRDLRLNAPVEMSLTTFQEEEDSGHSSETRVYMDVLVPTAEKESMTISKDLSNMKLVNQSYYNMFNSGEILKEYKVAVCETAEGYRIGFRNRETFAQTWMTYDTAAEENLAGKLESRVIRNTTGISGTVTNHTGYDLEGVCVVSGNKRVMIGSMENEETREFAEKDNTTGVDFDYYSIGTIPGLESGSAEYGKVVRILSSLYEQYAYSYGYGSTVSSGANTYTLAVIPNWGADYVTDERVKEYNYAAIVKHNKIELSDYPGATIVRLYDYAENNNGWDYDGQMMAQTAEVDFDLSMAVNGIQAIMRASNSEAQYGSTNNTKIYGWNIYTTQYEELFTNGALQMDFADGNCPYLSENGKIRLKFECRTAYEDYSPEIMIIGGGF